ncbi:MAG: hypothetical protein JWQ47_2760 [Glaciihabitans sp.]|nr:hypothetical protein [Glaciihabitans sp.]
MPRLGNPIPQLDYWPEETVVDEQDLVVAGISLLRLVEVCGTPAVHSAAAVIPDSGGQPSSSDATAVLVVRVLEVERRNSRPAVIRVDARLDDLRLVWAEALLIGRPATLRRKFCLVVHSSPDEPGACGTTENAILFMLPVDVVPGDLIAIPSRSLAYDGRPDEVAPYRHPLTGRADWQPSSALR